MFIVIRETHDVEYHVDYHEFVCFHHLKAEAERIANHLNSLYEDYEYVYCKVHEMKSGEIFTDSFGYGSASIADELVKLDGRRVTLDDIIVGRKFWVAMYLGDESFVYEIEVSKFDRSNRFIGVVGDNQEISLMDIGVIENNYNEHQTFFNEESARKYIEDLKNKALQ